MIYLQKMMSFYHIYVGLQEGKEKTTMNLVKDILEVYWICWRYTEQIGQIMRIYWMITLNEWGSIYCYNNIH